MNDPRETSPRPARDRTACAKRDEREAIETAVRALDGSAPEPQSNADKHDVATRLLRKGAEGEHPDPEEEGADRLPDRIIDRG